MSRLLKILLRKETHMEKAQRAMKGVKKRSQWMAKPPLNSNGNSYEEIVRGDGF